MVSLRAASARQRPPREGRAQHQHDGRGEHRREPPGRAAHPAEPGVGPRVVHVLGEEEEREHHHHHREQEREREDAVVLGALASAPRRRCARRARSRSSRAAALRGGEPAVGAVRGSVTAGPRYGLPQRASSGIERDRVGPEADERADPHERDGSGSLPSGRTRSAVSYRSPGSRPAGPAAPREERVGAASPFASLATALILFLHPKHLELGLLDVLELPGEEAPDEQESQPAATTK